MCNIIYLMHYCIDNLKLYANYDIIILTKKRGEHYGRKEGKEIRER